jgi:nucleoside-diphosphate-sugar epimerase
MTAILVTGGGGFVGRYLVPALQAPGDRVRVLALPGEDTSWLEARGVEVLRGDVREPETLVAAMRGIDAVVHLAAMMGIWSSWESYRAVNVDGTRNVCAAALDAGVRRLVHVSSWTAYGMNLRRTVAEDSPLTPPHEPYAASKAEADAMVQDLTGKGLPAVIVRPGTIFGPGDRLNFGRIADGIRNGRWLIVGSGGNALPLVFVTDVVEGLLRVLRADRAVGQAYNITNDRPLTQREAWELVAESLGASPPRRHVPYGALLGVAYAAEQAARLTGARQPLITRHGVMLFGGDNRHSIDKARRELGYEPQVPLREGLRLTADWYRTATAA